MMRRGDLWWADLGSPRGSEPARRRPVLVVSADAWNASTINTVIVVAITTNQHVGDFPGNVRVPVGTAGLEEDSVVNVSQVIAVDKRHLLSQIGVLPHEFQRRVDAGLRRALGLEAA